ncbi:MAG: Lrp/AsnC family transcriptional regulator [Candidatus Micrarchaeota archaeon]
MAFSLVSLDKIDHKILQTLLEDGRASFSQIARDVDLTDVAIKKRVESLKRKGVISSISANINFRVLGFENPVFVQIRTEIAKNKDIIKKLQAMDSVIELHQVLGEYNFLAKVLVTDLSSAEKTIGMLGQVDGVLDVKTLVAVSQLKTIVALPTVTLQKKL